jgi:hypothetical protein
VQVKKLQSSSLCHLLFSSLLGSKGFPENTILKHQCTNKSSILWDVTPCNALKVKPKFRKQGTKVLLATSFLLVFFLGLAYCSTLNTGLTYTSRTVLYRILRSGHDICFMLLSCSAYCPTLKFRRHIPPKCNCFLKGQLDIVYKEVQFFIATEQKASNPAG